MILIVFLFFGLLFGAFLFFRAGRYELVDSRVLFDVLIVGFLGLLFFGRIADFFVQSTVYNFSPLRLIFVNTYGSFDVWGALLGFGFFVFYYLRRKKYSFWLIFDLISAPFAFTLAIAHLGLFLSGYSSVYRVNLPKLFYFKAVLLERLVFSDTLLFFAWFFCSFWILKRLEAQKRFEGFFSCIFLVSLGLFALWRVLLASNKKMILNFISYDLIVAVILLAFSAFIWPVLSKRKLLSDLKGIGGFLLLSLFAMFRILKSVDEAGRFSKTIVFSPYFLLRSLYLSLKFLIREIFLSLVDLRDSFRGRK